MELTLHKPGDHNFIRSVGRNGITVKDEVYRDSLIVSADALIPDWPVRSMKEITAAHFQAVVELGPEVVLLGTGEKQAFLPPEIMMSLYSKGIGVEAMTTEAACRTFNVLLSEDRNAVAALIAISEAG
ncbi:MAG: Mth938-like domain-containing protein [Xanthomonadales bacterium]|jgi:uncharacterized protein|nr:Mth938-like domain-containing protein [Xanthomonadales bacterium]